MQGVIPLPRKSCDGSSHPCGPRRGPDPLIRQNHYRVLLASSLGDIFRLVSIDPLKPGDFERLVRIHDDPFDNTLLCRIKKLQQFNLLLWRNFSWSDITICPSEVFTSNLVIYPRIGGDPMAVSGTLSSKSKPQYPLYNG